MGRYRPPAPPKSPYITPEGARALQEELTHLWKTERPVVTAAVQAAAKNGDRSENGDYIYGKQKLREIDRRVRYLNKRLAEITVVDRLPAARDVIYFGAWVTLQDAKGSVTKLRIVGSDEVDGKRKISIDAPLAKQLIGKKAGSTVHHTSDGETFAFTVQAVEYETTTAC